VYQDDTIRKIIQENKQMKEKITALLEIIDGDDNGPNYRHYATHQNTNLDNKNIN